MGILWLKMGGETFEKLSTHLRWMVVWFREVGEEARRLGEADEHLENENAGIQGGQRGRGEIIVRSEKTHGAIIRFEDPEDEESKRVIDMLKHVIEKL